MIHTAQFYINIDNDEKDFLENKYKGDIFEAIKLINTIYKCKGIVINYTSKLHDGHRIIFTIDFIKLLGKVNVCEEDNLNINKEMNAFIFDIVGNRNKEEVLIRIDYRFDIAVDKRERETLLYLYNKTMDKFRFKKKYNQYDTTIYFNSKSIQSKVYDKEVERKDKHEKVEDYEENILRFEVAVRNQHLNYNKRTYNIEKSINQYLNDSLFKIYMKKNLETFLYKGDYYTIYKAKKIIKSSNIKENDKDEVIEMIKYISKFGVTKTKEKFSKYKFKKYINILDELNINPILIPKNLEGAPKYIKNPFQIGA